MLWLPKWLQTETDPAPANPSRRTFLFLGAAAGASLLLPAPLVRPEYHFEEALGSMNAILKAQYTITRELQGRVRITGPLILWPKGESAWTRAVAEEFQGLVVEHRQRLDVYRLQRLEDLRMKWATRPRVTAGALRSPIFADAPRLPKES